MLLGALRFHHVMPILKLNKNRNLCDLAKANELRAKEKEKEKTVKELDQALVNLERPKKNLKF